MIYKSYRKMEREHQIDIKMMFRSLEKYPNNRDNMIIK